MLRAKDKEGIKYFGEEANKSTEYFCPNCDEPIIFVNGIVVIKHFRHKVQSECESEPESKEHLNMKSASYKLMESNNFKNIDTEVRIGNQIADVYGEYNHIKYVIECQCSPISLGEYIERTDGWNNKGVYLIWIFGKKHIKEDSTESFWRLSKVARKYERFSLFHYDDYLFYKIEVKRNRTVWVEATDFGGGYDKYNKTQFLLKFNRYSNPIFKPYLNNKKQKRAIICEKEQKNI